jgi:hypothetical protein
MLVLAVFFALLPVSRVLTYRPGPVRVLSGIAARRTS